MYRTLKQWIRRWMSPIADPIQIIRGIVNYPRFFMDWWRYVRLAGAESIKIIDIYPRLHDRTFVTPFDSHYFYQNIWASRRISQYQPLYHVDIGSLVSYAGFLSTTTNVVFVDFRPLVVNVANLSSVGGSILDLPFKNNSIHSLSCLHVAEHIGLGRYGDPLDPDGTKKAIYELTRVLAPGGDLYFSLPVGKPSVCFNAHRIHTPQQIVDYFQNLKLIQLSGVNDDKIFQEGLAIGSLANEAYACGMFHFKKEY